MTNTLAAHTDMIIANLAEPVMVIVDGYQDFDLESAAAEAIDNLFLGKGLDEIIEIIPAGPGQHAVQSALLDLAERLGFAPWLAQLEAA